MAMVLVLVWRELRRWIYIPSKLDSINPAYIYAEIPLAALCSRVAIGITIGVCPFIPVSLAPLYDRNVSIVKGIMGGGFATVKLRPTQTIVAR